MRFLTAGLLGAGVLISQFTAAGTPASSPEQIGAVQAAIAFCSNADSKDDKEIERAARTLLPDMTEARIDAVRHTAAFQNGYQTIDSVLKGIAPEDAESLCAAAAHGTPSERDEPKGEHRHEHR